jgi:hypothetical protein
MSQAPYMRKSLPCNMFESDPPLVLHVLRSPIFPCCRSPLDSIQCIAPSSTGAALLATEVLSCASQGAGCHMIPDRGREAATVPSRASERARARKGRAAGHQTAQAGYQTAPPAARPGEQGNMHPQHPQVARRGAAAVRWAERCQSHHSVRLNAAACRIPLG